MNLFKNKIAFILVITAFVLSSCLSTKSLNEIVKNKIINDSYPVKIINNDYLVLKSDKLSTTDSLVSSKILSSYFIPAIIFWGKDNTLQCDISGLYFSNLFAEKLKNIALEVDLERILNDTKLEISLESVPNQFVYSDKFYFLFLLYVYSYNFNKTIYPVDLNYKVSYRLYKDNVQLKSGVFSLANVIPPLQDQWFSSSKMIEKYIESLKLNFENQTDEILNMILDDVEKN